MLPYYIYIYIYIYIYCQQCCPAMITMLLQHCLAIIVTCGIFQPTILQQLVQFLAAKIEIKVSNICQIILLCLNAK